MNGTVAPGFEPVARQLESLIADGEERGCAAAAYVDGEKVVDIWAGMADDEPWAEDTLAVTFSTTKGITALCVQMLADRGALDVDAPVARYWPEYGTAGKEGTLVRHLLNHTSGQHTFPNYWDYIAPDYKGVEDHELIASLLAAAPPAWKPGSKEMYHAITYGYLLGEVVKRVDGRSVGQFFREEVAEPLDVEFWVGLPDEQRGRLALPRADAPLPPGRRDTYRRRYTEAGREKVRANAVFDKLAWPFAILLAHPEVENPLELSRVANQPWFPGAELPAANGIGTARALAKVYAMLANGGEFDGHRFVSPESIRQFSTPWKAKGEKGRKTTQALGYGVVPPMFNAVGVGKGAFGSGGAGGTIVMADPVNRVSMAVTKNQMRDVSTAGQRLVLSLYQSLGRGTRVTAARQALLAGLVNHRTRAARVMNGIQWLGTFRGIDKANPLDRD